MEEVTGGPQEIQGPEVTEIQSLHHAEEAELCVTLF